MDGSKFFFSTYVEEDKDSGTCRVVCVFEDFPDADVARDFAEWFVSDFDGAETATLH